VRVWVDADACPRAAKELVYRAADRYGIACVFVANSAMNLPKSPHLSLQLVGAGFDVADDHIAESVEPGDLVITADIPLAARIVDAGALGIDPRGQLFDEDNVKSRLATRNLLAELRDQGLMGGGPPAYQPKDRANFASALDRTLQKLIRTGKA
jgi:uncharacterized protein